jgi:hypothetical protein
MTMKIWFLLLLLCLEGQDRCLTACELTVTSLAELAEYAAKSGNVITLKPGKYPFTDYIPLSSVAGRRERQEFPFLIFSGDDNTFVLDGVTIEFDTALRAALRPPIHTPEFLVAGKNITLQGLTIVNTGEGKSLGGSVLSVTGEGATLKNCTLHVTGSAPYGYGDLFGKGGYKHSAVHITGSHGKYWGCKLFMKSFGHGFYMQEDCHDIHFEDCTVKGVMRSTDEMLAETKGLAYERKFRTELVLRSGEARIMPNYMKALSEDAFRTYGQHKNLTFKNCTAKNMRGGFELRTKEGVKLENCTALGNERGFWVGAGAALTNCRGDAQHGPLLFAEGDKTNIELELLPTESSFTVHAAAIIRGKGSRIIFKASGAGERKTLLPLLIGFSMPAAGEGMAPIKEQTCEELVLIDPTKMPLVISAKAQKCDLQSRGEIRENHGQEIRLERLP